MSGIYEPEEVQQHTASSLIATPVGKALRGNNINYSYFIQSKVRLGRNVGSSCQSHDFILLDTKLTSIALFMTIWGYFFYEF